MTDPSSPREPSRDRRVPFFVVAGVLVLTLYFPTPEEFRRVPLVLAVTYFVLAALTALDHRSRRR